MAIVLPFKPRKAAQTCIDPHNSAAIIIFPGIRYERQAAPLRPKRQTGRRRNSPSQR